jgi:hypothetical protein
MQMPGSEPIVVIGRNRSGKDAGIGIYNGLRLEGKTWFVIGDRGFADSSPPERASELMPS